MVKFKLQVLNLIKNLIIILLYESARTATVESGYETVLNLTGNRPTNGSGNVGRTFYYSAWIAAPNGGFTT